MLARKRRRVRRPKNWRAWRQAWTPASAHKKKLKLKRKKRPRRAAPPAVSTVRPSPRAPLPVTASALINDALARPGSRGRFLALGPSDGLPASIGNEDRARVLDPLAFLDRLDVDSLDVIFVADLGHRSLEVVVRAATRLHRHGVLLVAGCHPKLGGSSEVVAHFRSEPLYRAYVLDTENGIGVIRHVLIPSVCPRLDGPLGLVTSEYHRTPIFINNFECLGWVSSMVEWLLATGASNLHIVDNDSTYPPLLAWYRDLPAGVHVHALGRNLGKRAPWLSGLVKRLMPRGGYYVVTDPDLDLSLLPVDTLRHLKAALRKFPSATKVGVGLERRDLPAESPIARAAAKWEKQFWTKPVKGDRRFFHAAVDTTFAMYRVEGLARMAASDTDLRCNYPYVARHLPWYLTEQDLGDEERHRYARVRNGRWGRALGTAL